MPAFFLSWLKIAFIYLFCFLPHLGIFFRDIKMSCSANISGGSPMCWAQCHSIRRKKKWTTYSLWCKPSLSDELNRHACKWSQPNVGNAPKKLCIRGEEIDSFTLRKCQALWLILFRMKSSKRTHSQSTSKTVVLWRLEYIEQTSPNPVSGAAWDSKGTGTSKGHQ